MYFRRYTRMTLYPALKYFSKYGVIDKSYMRFQPLYHMAVQNQPADQPSTRTRKLTRAQLKQKDLDTKLIQRLFLKYPDLKYEPISSQKFNGRKLNTFSYAYAFITEQKKLLQEGYSMDKSFEIVQQKYQQQMKRKLDQTLLSRGLAIGNRARSFLTLYQQQVEYQSRLKVLRTKRQMQKYEDKLAKLRSRIQQSDYQQQSGTSANAQITDYQRMFQKIVKQKTANQIVQAGGKERIQQRNQMINNVQKQFKNVFNQFYQRVTYKDRLEGLTDEQIIKNIHTSPNKIKRQNKMLIEFLKKKGSVTIDHVGQIRVSESENPKLREFLLTSPEVKIALLTQRLNYEKPLQVKGKRNNNLLARRSQILQNRPDKLSKQQLQLIKYNKKLDLQTVSQTDIPSGRQAYKIFESAQERLLRLQLKYLNLMCQTQLEQMQKKRQQNNAQAANKHKQRYEQSQYTLNQTIQRFRRLKYRLQNKFRKDTAEEFLFVEHSKLGSEATHGQEADYEDLMLYLRKRSQQRRLTSISQSYDNKIHEYLVHRQIPEYPQTQGEVKSKIE